MIIRRGFTSLIICAIAGTALTASAQAPRQQQPVRSATAAPTSAGVNVALLDIAKVFKNHKGFEARMQQLRDQKKKIEEQVIADRNRLLEKRKGLQGYNPGTREYKQLEEQLANDAADAQVKMELQKKELLEQEAQAYLQTYNQIQSAVGRIANQYQLRLVLRFDSQQIDQNNPNDILKGINRAVIYQQNLDITDTVLQMVSPGTPPAGGGTQVGNRNQPGTYPPR